MNQTPMAPDPESSSEALPAAKKSRSLLHSSGLVSLMTMLSRVLGLARDMVIANQFGAGAGADAFFVAFKIPNFLRRLFAEGAFAQAFVPVLSEYRSQRSQAEVRRLLGAVAGTLGLVLMVLTALAVFGSPVIAYVFAPGFHDDPVKFALTAEMLRITFPYLLLISLTAFAGSVLNSYDRFAVPAFTPVLLNLAMIAAALWLSPRLSVPVVALAWGVLIAGILQFFFQLPFLMRIGLLPRPRLDYRHEGVQRILKLMVPALFGVSVSQINLLLDTILASFLQTGSVSWLYYSDRLMELPLGVFGIAIATVILPSLSRKYAEKSTDEFSRMMDWGVRTVLLIGLPAALALALLAEPLLITLFYHGALEPRDIEMAAMSLRAYSAGLIAFMLIKVLAPGFFARQDTRTPVRIGVIAMVANMVFNLMLVFSLAHVGLALATTLAAFLNAGLLAWGLHKERVWRFQSGWLKFGGQLLVANGLLVAFVLLVNYSDELWMQQFWYERAAWLALLTVGGMAVYFIALFTSGIRLRQFRMRS